MVVIGLSFFGHGADPDLIILKQCRSDTDPVLFLVDPDRFQILLYVDPTISAVHTVAQRQRGRIVWSTESSVHWGGKRQSANFLCLVEKHCS